MTVGPDNESIQSVLDISRLSIENDPRDQTETLTDLIKSAVSLSNEDEKPRYNLSEIAQYLSNAEGELVERCLDPLSTLSYLLCSTSPGSQVLLNLMMERCSPKEVIVAAEENLERIHRAVTQADDDNDDDDNNEEETGDEGPEQQKEEGRLPISAQIPRLVQLFSVIPKISFRRKSRKSPFETIKSFIPDLQSTVQINEKNFSTTTGRATILQSAALTERILDWVQAWALEKQNDLPGEDGKEEVKKEIDACKVILLSFLTSILNSLGHCIQAQLAKRAFIVCFPRLARNKLDTGWEKGAEAAAAATSAYTRAGGPESISSAHIASTKTSLVLLAHSLLPSSNTIPSANLNRDVDISTYVPIILASIQTNSLLDESLAVLLLQFNPPPSSPSPPPSDPEILTPLLTLIPSLTSFHPDPFVRYCTFKILGLILDAAPDLLRAQVLRDLVKHSADGMEKMRVAAVGLVKDAVLKALSSASKSSVLASPRFLQSFGPILFVPNPPDLFTDLDVGNEVNENLKKKRLVNVLRKLEEDSTQLELSRLAECLGLYYVVHRRDEKNRTGIRDRDNRANVERTLLGPIRKVLPGLIGLTENEGEGGEDEHSTSGSIPPARSHEHHHAEKHALLMPLIALQVGLERVDEYHGSLSQ